MIKIYDTLDRLGMLRCHLKGAFDRLFNRNPKQPTMDLYLAFSKKLGQEIQILICSEGGVALFHTHDGMYINISTLGVRVIQIIDYIRDFYDVELPEYEEVLV